MSKGKILKPTDKINCPHCGIMQDGEAQEYVAYNSDPDEMYDCECSVCREIFAVSQIGNDRFLVVPWNEDFSPPIVMSEYPYDDYRLDRFHASNIVSFPR